MGGQASIESAFEHVENSSGSTGVERERISSFLYLATGLAYTRPIVKYPASAITGHFAHTRKAEQSEFYLASGV